MTTKIYTIPEHAARVAVPDVTIYSAADLEHMVFPPVRWAVPGILPAGLALLSGKPKCGKSWLALNIAIACACGGVALSHCRVPQVDVLYIALEDNRRRMKRRMVSLTSGAGWPKNLHFAHDWPTLEHGGADRLRTWLRAHRDAGLVIGDTLAKLRGHTEKKDQGSAYAADYAAVGEFKRVADEFEIAFVLIHHLRKQESDDPHDQVSGTTGLTGAADASLVLRRERGKADAVLYVVGRDIANDPELGLRFDPSRGLWSVLGPADLTRMTEERLQIVRLLSDQGPMKPWQVAQALGKNRDAVAKALERMFHDGQVANYGGGTYYPQKKKEEVSEASELSDVSDVSDVSPTPSDTPPVGG